MEIFNKIKAHVESGKDINEYCTRESVLYFFLGSYYQHDVYGYGDIEDVPENAVAEELKLPLKDRPSGILDQMNWLLDHGADVNAGGEWLPLMDAVGSLDVAMTEYLLEHGANPHYAGRDDGIPYGCGNYYIDELDIIALDESFVSNPDKSVFDRVLQIAVLFAKQGVTDVHTHCISIDSKTRTVSVSKAKVMW